MREYTRYGSTIVPSSAPVLASAWDSDNASIVTHHASIGDEDDFIPKCLERWRDRQYLRQRRMTFLDG